MMAKISRISIYKDLQFTVCIVITTIVAIIILCAQNVTPIGKDVRRGY